jgi:hypothetical protein
MAFFFDIAQILFNKAFGSGLPYEKGRLFSARDNCFIKRTFNEQLCSDVPFIARLYRGVSRANVPPFEEENI